MDKQTVLQQVETEFANLLRSFDGLDEQAMSERFYGEWNVKDILAHISGWQHLSAEWMERMARGEKPTPEGSDFSQPDAWNARFAAAMKPQSSPTVVADLRQSYATLLRAARAIPDERFGEGKTVNRILEGNGYGHYKEHAPAIAEHRKSKAG